MLQFIGGLPVLLIEIGQGGVLVFKQGAQARFLLRESFEVFGHQLVSQLQGADGAVGISQRLGAFF
ncbi:hypothetical protein K3H51_08450 [Aeromonas veronii]|nr:hypothetical protein [Aeromonas veronii]